MNGKKGKECRHINVNKIELCTPVFTFCLNTSADVCYIPRINLTLGQSDILHIPFSTIAINS